MSDYPYLAEMLCVTAILCVFFFCLGLLYRANEVKRLKTSLEFSNLMLAGIDPHKRAEKLHTNYSRTKAHWIS